MTIIVALGDPSRWAWATRRRKEAGAGGPPCWLARWTSPRCTTWPTSARWRSTSSALQLPAAVALKPDVASVIVGHQRHAARRLRPGTYRRGGRPHGGGAAGVRRGGAHHAAARPGPDVRAAGRAGPAAGPPDARGERGRGRGGAAARHGAPGRGPRPRYLRAPLLERGPAAPERARAPPDRVPLPRPAGRVGLPGRRWS